MLWSSSPEYGLYLFHLNFVRICPQSNYNRGWEILSSVSRMKERYILKICCLCHGIAWGPERQSHLDSLSWSFHNASAAVTTKHLRSQVSSFLYSLLLSGTVLQPFCVLHDNVILKTKDQVFCRTSLNLGLSDSSSWYMTQNLDDVLLGQNYHYDFMFFSVPPIKRH